jgi:beta-aspartyl-dipeptidase (metallo-type)
MITIIGNGELYTPEPAGRTSILILGDRIARIGEVDRRAVEALGLETNYVDAAGHFVAPGLIDPHEHLAGGSGEHGFATATPPICVSEIVQAGITTVVGCLGVDTITKTMPALLAQTRALMEDGLTAFLYSGGYTIPPATLTGSIHSDILFIPEVIGAGEVAVSDRRSSAPSSTELARLVKQAQTAGALANKAGVTHFHMGETSQRLAPIRSLLDDHEIAPETLYPTHVERTEALMEEALELTARGITVDVDVVEQDLPRWVKFYFDRNADPGRLTVSSDASITSPRTLLGQIRACIFQHKQPLERMLPLVTSNTARVLKLPNKGRLIAGADADLIILDRATLELRHVFARGRHLLADGALRVRESFLHASTRIVSLRGEKA